MNNAGRLNIISTDEEQSICKSCGFCCDGTLFGHVDLRADDEQSN